MHKSQESPTWKCCYVNGAVCQHDGNDSVVRLLDMPLYLSLGMILNPNFPHLQAASAVSVVDKFFSPS